MPLDEKTRQAILRHARAFFFHRGIVSSVRIAKWKAAKVLEVVSRIEEVGIRTPGAKFNIEDLTVYAPGMAEVVQAILLVELSLYCVIIKGGSVLEIAREVGADQATAPASRIPPPDDTGWSTPWIPDANASIRTEPLPLIPEADDDETVTSAAGPGALK